MDEDGFPDLVLYTSCGENVIPEGGWPVYRGGPDGFATTATTWSVPSVEYPLGAYGMYSFLCEDRVTESTAFQGYLDKKPGLDIVVTHTCDDNSVGDTRWLLHSGDGEGFATAATDWPLPEYGAEGVGVFSSTYNQSCDNDVDQPAYILAEVDGREGYELVVFGCVVSGEWVLHPNTGAGFGEGISWSLPDRSATCTEDATTDPSEVLDLDGDGLVDLVVTAGCGDGAGITNWYYYPGKCAL